MRGGRREGRHGVGVEARQGGREWEARKGGNLGSEAGRKSGSLMLTQFQPRDHSPGGQGSGYPRPGYPPVKTSSGGPGVSSNLYSSTTHSAGGFVMPGRN